jgi:AraC family transcriptional regulator of adaptative response / DNA-3-methyladenine glycosylase II
MCMKTLSAVRAVQSKDARFDGWFFTARHDRHLLPAELSGGAAQDREHAVLSSAAAAQQAGFRASSGAAPTPAPARRWNARRTSSRAMRLIADGVVDRDGVPGLAGAGSAASGSWSGSCGSSSVPVRSRARAQRAQQPVLIETTSLPMADVAMAAGFATIRTFALSRRSSPSRLPSCAGVRVRHTGGGHRHADTAPAVAYSAVPGQPLRAPAATAVPGLKSGDGAYRPDDAPATRLRHRQPPPLPIDACS